MKKKQVRISRPLRLGGSMKPICELGLFSLSLSFRNWTCVAVMPQFANGVSFGL
jgi:hypothetical protein